MLYVLCLLEYMRKKRGLHSRLGVVLLETIAHRMSWPCSQRRPYWHYRGVQPIRDLAPTAHTAVQIDGASA